MTNYQGMDFEDNRIKKFIKDNRIFFLAGLVALVLFFIFSNLSDDREERRKIPMPVSESWQDLGRIQDVFYFVEEDILMARTLQGGLLFSKQLPPGEQDICYGIDCIYILTPKNRLEVIDGMTGDTRYSLETEDISRIERKNGYLVAYSDRLIRILDEKLALRSALPLRSMPVAYVRSEKGLEAWIEKGPADGVRQEGEVVLDPEMVFLPEDKNSGTNGGEGKTGQDSSEEDLPEDEESSLLLDRFRLSMKGEGELYYQIASAAETFLSLDWLGEDRLILQTDQFLYLISSAGILQKIELAGPVDYLILKDQLILLNGRKLSIFDQEGQLEKSYDLDFAAKGLAKGREEFVLVGESEFARLLDGRLSVEKTSKIISVTENANGTVDFIFEDGIEHMDL